MPGWVPSKKSIGGIYAGRDFLNVAMDDWKDYASVQSVGSDGLFLTADIWGDHARVSGTIGDAYVAYKLDHTGTNYNLICEFEIKKPANAQFKKQSICFYLNDNWGYRNWRGEEFYEISTLDFSISRKRYFEDGTSSESTVYSQHHASNIISRWVLNYLTGWDGGLNNPNLIILNTGKITYNDEAYFGFGICFNNDIQSDTHSIKWFGKKVSQLAIDFDVDEENFEPVVIDDPNYDENTDFDDEDFDYKGGDGTHDDHSDDIDNPDLVAVGGASSGICSLYFGGTSVMRQFADFLYSDNFLTEIIKWFNGALDWVVSCTLFPLLPDYGGAGQPQWGNVVCPVSMSKVQNQFKKINCGDLYIDPYYGNCFDYAPYTRIEIWLPYIGYRELPVDEVMRQTINVEYQVDFMSGDCVAVLSIVSDAHKVLEQWTGNIGCRVPLAAVSHDSLVSGALQQMIGGLQVVGAISIGAATGVDNHAVVADGMKPAAKDFSGTTMATIEAFKPHLHRTRSNADSTGFMSVQKPYIIKHIPIQSRPDAFMELNGYMSDISGKLGDFEGYTEVETIRLERVAAYEEEINEIIALLQGGVII